MKRDHSTLDLFAARETKSVVPRFEEAEVRAWNRSRRLKRGIAKTLGDCSRSRDEIARAMGEEHGETVSKAMLDNYASQEKDHEISALRLVALVGVTRDARALNLILAEIGLVAVEAKYEALLRREKARELKERAAAEELAADAEWRAKR